ncbi:hypothetical protein H8E88_04590 [candidate division KSB1 bacterium]|nr:hypothetical protein [candidate division KSB1 bacterium]
MKTNTTNKIFTILLISISVFGIIYFSYSIFTDKKIEKSENPYEYNIEFYKNTEENLIHYKEVKRIPILCENLYGIAIDSSDYLYISADKFLIKLDKNGSEVFRVNLDHPAKCLTVGKNGNIYLSMKNLVQVFDESGQKQEKWRDFEDNTLITSIAVSTENVFIADATNKIVLRFDKSGKLIGRIGKKNEAREIPGFVVPSPYFDLAIDDDGFLWVVNPGRHSFENYTNEGDLRSFWGEYSMKIDGFCGCCNPSHFAFLSDGSFVTSEKGIIRIKVYNAIGELVSVVASPDQFSEDTVGLDLAVDSKDQIYVLDPRLKVIKIYSKM